MKIILLILGIVLTGNLAMACLGGHIKSVKIADQEVLSINMNDNTVSTSASNLELLSISESNVDGIFTGVCGGDAKSECDEVESHKIAGKSIAQIPNYSLKITFLNKDNDGKITFEIGHFVVTRGCGS